MTFTGFKVCYWNFRAIFAEPSYTFRINQKFNERQISINRLKKFIQGGFFAYSQSYKTNQSNTQGGERACAPDESSEDDDDDYDEDDIFSERLSLN